MLTKHRRPSFLFAALTALGVSLASPAAEACGGCFHEPAPPTGESTVVVGHRMIFSVSPEQTTLWDQISYSGAPSSFAWILPVRAPVEVDLSSDALFELIEDGTRVEVRAPSCYCDFSSSSDATTATSDAATGTGGGGEVTVVASETVGPYETVQLSSSDGQALVDWLASHNYVVPDDLVPVIEAYVKDGMDFLAMKLVPGEGVSAMRPVRVSTPGAGLTLPLRMVAGGAGAYVPLHLWVFGSGRYEPQSHPWFMVHEDDLIWNWDTGSSNYKELVAKGQSQEGGTSWLLSTSASASASSFYSLCDQAAESPLSSGYDDGSGDGAAASALCEADLKALVGNDYSPWITHLFGNLPRAALSQDLVLQASADQSPVTRLLYAPYAVGKAPCDNCEGFAPPSEDAESDGDCAYGPQQSTVGAGILLALLAIAAVWRKR